jgi:hypothetical protein
MTPIRYERQADGKLAAWVAPEGDRVLLRQAGECLARDLGAEAYERFIALDRVYWDFALGRERLSLLWDEKQGLAVLAGDASPHGEEMARRVAEHLAARLPSLR